jgi:hypothetical protein
LLDADADRADLELRLISLLLKYRARVHPFAGSGGSWRVSDHRRDAGGRRLELDLFGHIQSVIYLNPEISDRAF